MTDRQIEAVAEEQEIWVKVAESCASAIAGNHKVQQYRAIFNLNELNPKIIAVPPSHIDGIYEHIYQSVMANHTKPYSDAISQLETYQRHVPILVEKIKHVLLAANQDSNAVLHKEIRNLKNALNQLPKELRG